MRPPRLIPITDLVGYAYQMVDSDSYAFECVLAAEAIAARAPADPEEAFMAALEADAAMTRFPPDPNLPADHPDNQPPMRAIRYSEREPLLRALSVLRVLAALDNPRSI